MGTEFKITTYAPTKAQAETAAEEAFAEAEKINAVGSDYIADSELLGLSKKLIEPLELHFGISGKQALHRAIDALAEVGIHDPEKRVHGYPHEFSGGMRQRVWNRVVRLRTSSSMVRRVKQETGRVAMRLWRILRVVFSET